MSNFVKSWNENNELKMEFLTVSEFGKKLNEDYKDKMQTQRGDWTDHWTDGPGSSSYETGLNRKTHELLLSYEATQSILKRFVLSFPVRPTNFYPLSTFFLGFLGPGTWSWALGLCPGYWACAPGTGPWAPARGRSPTN